MINTIGYFSTLGTSNAIAQNNQSNQSATNSNANNPGSSTPASFGNNVNVFAWREVN